MSILARTAAALALAALVVTWLALLTGDPGAAAVQAKYPPPTGGTDGPDWRAALSAFVAVGGLFVTRPRPPRAAHLV